MLNNKAMLLTQSFKANNSMNNNAIGLKKNQVKKNHQKSSKKK